MFHCTIQEYPKIPKARRNNFVWKNKLKLCLELTLHWTCTLQKKFFKEEKLKGKTGCRDEVKCYPGLHLEKFCKHNCLAKSKLKKNIPITILQNLECRYSCMNARKRPHKRHRVSWPAKPLQGTQRVIKAIQGQGCCVSTKQSMKNM